jgi:hypothetical protein
VTGATFTVTNLGRFDIAGHRLVDGAPAASFLQRLSETLAMPYFSGAGRSA